MLVLSTMPTYELCLVLRSLPRPSLVEVVKRSCEKVLNEGGVIRKMESMGERTLPQKQIFNDETHTKGVYFNVRTDARCLGS